MHTTLGGQGIRERRRTRNALGQSRVFAVENAQRVAMQAATAVFVEQFVVRREVLDEFFAVYASALRRTERVQFEAHTGDAKTLPQPRREQNEFRVDIRTGKAIGFDVNLVKLAVTPLLGPLATEHGACRPQTVPLVVQQAVGDGGTHQAGRSFWPQRERVTVAVGEGEHFFLNDIRVFADGALEQRRLLQ